MELSRIKTTIESEPRQTIQGWGIYPYFGPGDFGSFSKDAYSEEVSDALFRQLGINFARFKISHEFYDTDAGDGSLRQELLIELAGRIRNALDHGVSFYILSVWSAPIFMKDPSNVRAKDDAAGVSHLRPGYESDYIEYLVKVLKSLEHLQLPAPVGISIQNELLSQVPWDGCIWEARQYRRVVIALRQALDKEGFSTIQIHGPEAGNTVAAEKILGADFANLRDDPELRHAIGGIAHHTYDQFEHERADANAVILHGEMLLNLGKPVWMTEWSIPEGKTELERAINGARHLARDVTIFPSNYWCWWLGWAPNERNGEALTWGAGPHRSKLFCIFRELWNRVTPGFQVHRVVMEEHQHLSTRDAYHSDLVVFRGISGSVILAINPTEENLHVTLHQADAATHDIYRTCKSHDMRRVGTVSSSGLLHLELPPHSVTIAASPSAQV